MKKIQYSIQVHTCEVDDYCHREPWSHRFTQLATINEELPFEKQIEIAKDLLEKVMKTLRKEHEKNQD